MKKKLLSGLVILGAASMLCGFDSAETLESLSEKMNEASAAAEGVNATMDMNVDAAVNLNDGTNTTPLNFMLDAAYKYSIAMKPFAMQMEGTMDMSGVTGEQSMALEMYGVTDENGAMKTYAYTEDGATGEGQWVVDTNDDMDINAMIEASAASAMNYADLAEWGLSFELAPEAADVDGTECYMLSTVIDSTSLNTLLAKASEMTGEDLTSDENVTMALSMLEGLKIDVIYYVDAATYLPVKIHMNMNDSDFSTLSAMINSFLGSAATEDAPATTAELAVNNISIDMLTSYGAAPEITVPQEALDAEASGAAESIEDLEDAAEDAAEDAVDAD